LKDRIAAHSVCSEETALSVTAMIVGAMAIIHTIDDQALRFKLVNSCKNNVQALLSDSNSSRPLSFFWEISNLNEVPRSTQSSRTM
jgi:hypothetical protein